MNTVSDPDPGSIGFLDPDPGRQSNPKKKNVKKFHVLTGSSVAWKSFMEASNKYIENFYQRIFKLNFFFFFFSHQKTGSGSKFTSKPGSESEFNEKVRIRIGVLHKCKYLMLKTPTKMCVV